MANKLCVNKVYFAWVYITFAWPGVNCIIQFQHDTEQCLDQLVEYQCTVTGTGFTSLTWRISDDNGTQLGNTVSYTSNGGIGALVTIGEFTVEQLQPVSPVVSNISFTVQSSINGYTIECEDSTNALNNESDTINDDDKLLITDYYYYYSYRL